MYNNITPKDLLNFIEDISINSEPKLTQEKTDIVYLALTEGQIDLDMLIDDTNDDEDGYENEGIKL